MPVELLLPAAAPPLFAAGPMGAPLEAWNTSTLTFSFGGAGTQLWQWHLRAVLQQCCLGRQGAPRAPGAVDHSVASPPARARARVRTATPRQLPRPHQELPAFSTAAPAPSKQDSFSSTTSECSRRCALRASWVHLAARQGALPSRAPPAAPSWLRRPAAACPTRSCTTRQEAAARPGVAPGPGRRAPTCCCLSPPCRQGVSMGPAAPGRCARARAPPPRRRPRKTGPPTPVPTCPPHATVPQPTG
jgi:hypothetical protein